MCGSLERGAGGAGEATGAPEQPGQGGMRQPPVEFQSGLSGPTWF